MIEMKYLDFSLKAKALKSEVQNVQKEEEILDIILKDGNTVCAYLKFIPLINENISQFDLDDLVLGYFTDRFKVEESNITEQGENIFIEVKFSFSFNPNESIFLDKSQFTFYNDGIEYKYDIKASFVKAYEESLLKDIKTNIEILSLESSLNIEEMR